MSGRDRPVGDSGHTGSELGHQPSDGLPTLDLGEDPRADIGGVELAAARAALRRNLLGESPEPIRIGRFVVVGELGAGAFGTVYSAYDPKLDRKVALKVLRAQRASDGGSSRSARLVREAKAMARLSHPNVIAVHDVGALDGDEVFLAMEEVAGQTLTRWLETERSWRAIVDVFVQAARGLAAAHDAGLVHRDFKPDNVLVGDDGRVRVTDFGLARFVAFDEELDPMTSSEVRAIADTLVQTLGPAGTPRYMAPEQHRAEPSDARTDQFGLCVSLYDALFGDPPFAGDTVAELMREVTAGNVREPPADRGVPAPIRRAVLRGLSVSPGDRYPSMDALIADLTADPFARRRAVSIVVVMLAVVGAIGYAAYYAAGDRDRACQGAADAIEGVWDDGRRDDVRAAFAATQQPFAVAAADRVIDIVDDYARAWQRTQTDACIATRVDKTQSAEALDLRIGCLRRRLDAVDALATVLVDADAKLVSKAADAAYALPSLDRCSDIDALRAAVPPPEDATTAAAIVEVERTLAAIDVLAAAGRYRPGLDIARDGMDAAMAIEHAPLTSEAAMALGRMQALSGDYAAAAETLDRAYLAALGARRDDVATDASTLLATVVGVRLERVDDGARWAELAAALVDRAGGNPLSVAAVEASRGALAKQRGDLEAAEAHHGRALELREAELGDAHPRVAESLNTLGLLRQEGGDLPGAIELHQRGLTILERALGAKHPSVAGALNNLATVYSRGGRYDEALANYLRARDILIASVGPDHPNVANTETNLGIVAYFQQRYEDALAHHATALDIVERTLGPDHRAVGLVLNNIGLAQQAMDRFDEAVATYERAVDLQRARTGDRHPGLIGPYNNLGGVLLELEQWDRAEAYFERAKSIAEEAHGPEHGDVAHALNGIGQVLLARGDAAGAVEMLERAYRVWLAELGDAHPNVGHVAGNLARAFEALGRRARALELYEREREIFEAVYGAEHPNAKRAADALERLR